MSQTAAIIGSVVPAQALPTTGGGDRLFSQKQGESVMIRRVAFALLVATSAASHAQRFDASLDQLAATPVVTVHISEQLRAPPDQATVTVSTDSHEPTASAALASNKTKTEQLLAAIRAAGIGPKDTQTEG